jgi:ABC-2 type transport system ATP-binding protein
MDITQPDSGSLEVLGSSKPTDVKDRVGYLPEERGLYRRMTVEQTLRYLGELKGLSGAELTRRVNEALEKVALTDWRKKRVEALSKGMQQKLQFIASTIHRPELVILDEPFGGLDPINVELLLKLMAELRRGDATVIFSTHQMETAERLCDRIVLINRGRKLVEGAIHEVRARFQSRVALVEGDGDLSSFARHPAVRDAHTTAGRAEFELYEGVDPNALLRDIVERVRVTRFSIESLSLQQIFVRLVGDDIGVDQPGGLADGRVLVGAD